jgi:glutathione peroxidase
VLAFPCNQFGGQEPGTHEEILNFVDKFNCRDKLTWFAKGDVNGANAKEVFSFLKQELPSEDGTADVRWNFAKFLVDHEGKPYKRYAPTESPFQFQSDIEDLLKRKEEAAASK